MAMSADLVDETMNEIRRNWNVTLQDEQTNPAHSLESFDRLHDQLEQCMEWIIENNYTGFNGAVSTFGGIVECIKESKKLSKEIKMNLQEFRDQIQYKRTDLPELWSKIEGYKLKISALTTLAEMKKLRSQAKSLMAKRFFVPAARVLAGILQELDSIGKYLELADVNFAQSLQDDKELLMEKLLEEFCQHAFLKVDHSTSELLAQAFSKFPQLEDFPSAFCRDHKRQPLVVPESDLVLVPTEFNYNPETNVIAYIQSLFQAAHCLGTFADFTTAIEQRLTSELFQIADQDMKATHRKFHRERLAKDCHDHEGFIYIPSNLMSPTESIEIKAFFPFLQSLIDTLIVKFSVIISVFSTLKSEDTDEIVSLQKLFQATNKAIHLELHNVLGTFLKGSSNLNMKLVTSSSFSAAAGDTAAQLNNQNLFKVSIHEDDEIDAIGNIGRLLTQKEKVNAKKLAKMLVVDPYSSTKEEFGHRSIVKPSLQYLPLLYPTITFFKRCLQESEIGSDDLFLEKYFSEDFLPFLDSFVNQGITMAFNGLDCMVPEPLSEKQSEAVLLEGKYANEAPRAFKVFIDLCSLLTNLVTKMPNHLLELEGVLKALLTTFSDRIVILFKNLTSSQKGERVEDVQYYFSARIASQEDLHNLLAGHPLLQEDHKEEPLEAILELTLSEKESLLLEKLKSDRSLFKEEVIFDHKKIYEIALFHRGLALLLEYLLKGFPGEKALFDSAQGKLGLSEDGGVVFNSEFHSFFKTFIATIKTESLTSLLTLRLEFRTHAFYYVDLTLRESNYALEEPADEPDSYVSMLYNELNDLDSILTDWLPFNEHLFCVEGLSRIFELILINGFRYIKDINDLGFDKLYATVKTVEQLITLICPPSEPELEKVIAFYDLARTGPEKLIEVATDSPFKFTQLQYQAILDVYYKPGGDEDDNDEAVVAQRKEYQNQLVRIQYLNK